MAPGRGHRCDPARIAGRRRAPAAAAARRAASLDDRRRRDRRRGARRRDRTRTAFPPWPEGIDQWTRAPSPTRAARSTTCSSCPRAPPAARDAAAAGRDAARLHPGRGRLRGGTRMNEHARECEAIVLYPEQAQRAHGQKCWNWFKTQHQQRGRGEPACWPRSRCTSPTNSMRTARADLRGGPVGGRRNGGRAGPLLPRCLRGGRRALGASARCGARHDVGTERDANGAPARSPRLGSAPCGLPSSSTATRTRPCTRATGWPSWPARSRAK
jgi:hypothetical protein